MRKIEIKDCPGCPDINIRRQTEDTLLCAKCRKSNRVWRWNQDNPGRNAAVSKAWREVGNKPNRAPDYNTKRAEAAKERYHTDSAYQEACKENAKRYRRENPEKVREMNKNYQIQNSEKLKIYRREYARSNRESQNDNHKRQLLGQTVWRIRQWKPIPNRHDWVRDVEDHEISSRDLQRLHAWQEEHCYICNRPYTKAGNRSANGRTIEHIIPRSLGGNNNLQNIVHSCYHCNCASRRDQLLYSEWLPDKVIPVTDRFFVSYKTIGENLKMNGISAEYESDSGAWLLNESRRLFIVSTFWSSTRNPGSNGGKVIIDTQKIFPDAIFILDYEWYSRMGAVINMLKAKLKIAERSGQARELSVESVFQPEADEFLKAHHVMGTVNAPYRIALKDGDKIMAIALFQEDEKFYDCVRLAFRGHVPGGMSKLISHFRATHESKPIISFLDTRYANGEGHETIGFERIETSGQTFWWVFPDKVRHQRYLSNDNKASRGLIYFDPSLNIEGNALINGVYKLYCPKKKKLLLK